MKLAEKRYLQVTIVGFDTASRRKIRNIWPQAVFETRTLFQIQNMPRVEMNNSLWIVELDRQSAAYVDSLGCFLNQTKSLSPTFLVSDTAADKSQLSSVLEELLECIGATVYVGNTGFQTLCRSLEELAAKHPDEVIVETRMSDDGLHVSFADKKKALLSLAEVKRLAESREIIWDSLRIGRDRSYITLSTIGGDVIPIPHDVIREFIKSGPGHVVRRSMREKNLTARTVGVTLSNARKSKGLTQGALAAQAKTSRWTIHRIEKGQYLPKVALLDKLSRALGESLETMLTR